MQYSLNGSATRTSQSNTIDASSAGLTGLTITAQSAGSASITVGADTSTIASAITQFVTDYNTVQNYIASQTTFSTATSSATGSTDSTAATTATAGILMGDMDAEGIATSLRQLADASPLSGVIQSLNDLGITSDGTDNLLTTNSDVLNTALANNLGQVTQLFTDSTTGLAKTLGTYLSDTLGDNGVISTKEQNLTKQSTTIGNSITALQNKITADESRMENEFVQMEDAINTINVSKEYLSAYFGSSSTSTSTSSSSSSSS